MAPGGGAYSVAVNVRLPHAHGDFHPRSYSVTDDHARRDRDTVPIADTNAVAIRVRHRVAYSLRDADTDPHADTDSHADPHGHDHTSGDTHTHTDGLRFSHGTVISDT
jgi:hypothetical protein